MADQELDRDIGALGTISRVAVGAAAIAVPVAIWGSTGWDWAAGLVGFPLLAVAAAALFAALDADARAPYARALAGPVFLALLLGGATAVTYVSSVDATGVWIFVGASMLLAAAKGYGGCELLAFWNAATGRQDRIGCLVFAPIDALERAADRRITAAR